ncbi:fructose-bisphosphate aldolase class II [Propionibacteriaceae bacterium ES.041]|uniref:class II fructose-bisphosphate aldolase n=1 Tax=Enemella evansiae TaxID=2016499 RepID=UPI000B96E456|nr:class II fructose-bisphosphate aldolase [Enemella evansiae]OYN99291.1 fructose-bisphosphate aldolase [Enemella evansiae]PFG67140.1 fructose-bisphosphate aldolase class II [Propionibacteriaceae bacterium ES.041]
MALVSTSELVAEAYQAGTGTVAFNVITLEHAEAILDGAQRAERPVILQVSQNAIRFHGGLVTPILAACRALAVASPVRASIHLDHLVDPVLLRAGADAGASSLMYDASRLDYQQNLAATRAETQWAHEQELFLEAELGEVGGKDGAHAPGVRTDPEEARAFVAATGVDALAVAVGSSHAMASRTATLDFDLIARLRAAVDVPLVLHGSSGVANEDLRRAVEAGITKVNVGTILNVEFTRAVRDLLDRDPAVVDPRSYLTPARDAMAETVHAILKAVS